MRRSAVELVEDASCKDGDVFVTRTRSGYEDPGNADEIAVVKPGRRLYIDPSYGDAPERGIEAPWTVPANVRVVDARKDPLVESNRLLVTPAALPAGAAPALASDGVYLRMDPTVPNAREYARNVVARIDPLAHAYNWSATQEDEKYASIRTGLFVGSGAPPARRSPSLHAGKPGRHRGMPTVRSCGSFGGFTIRLLGIERPGIREVRYRRTAEISPPGSLIALRRGADRAAVGRSALTQGVAVGLPAVPGRPTDRVVGHLRAPQGRRRSRRCVRAEALDHATRAQRQPHPTAR
ncbi:hypothetical protein GCM10010228_58080 [Streptomyces massasporeus]|nr:hypothetical protein GCM10010228_58080 [Streptomyces massasporeus]